MFLFCQVMDKNNIFMKYKLIESCKVIKEFNWLIDSYVLDFYVENHWTKLSSSWQSLFESIHPEDLPEILDEKFDSANFTRIWPLSLLCLKVLKQKLCIKRLVSEEQSSRNLRIENLINHSKLKRFFMKGIKQKKQHEIIKMSQICFENASNRNIKYLVDFGAGLGHLSRVLSFNYGFKVCCLEMQDELNIQARIIDDQLKNAIAKYAPESEYAKHGAPIHITFKLTESETPEDFLQKIKCALQISNDCESFSFGFLALHPCGNLAATLMNLFLKIKEASFLNLVGCCYMKLNEYGYPLSNFTKSLPNLNYLSYESKEIACHAIEVYNRRLENNSYIELKVHSYRAALEKLIIKFFPECKHSGLKSIKLTSNLTFKEYCRRAISNTAIKIPIHEIESKDIDDYLRNWKRIVIFYTLRLFFAPLIESVILYDRMIYLWENEIKADIEAVFDPYISPRNHIITASKQ